MTDTTKYQLHTNGPLKREWIDFLNQQRIDNKWSFATLGSKLGISGAFAHAILNKPSNITTATAMQHIAKGIDALTAGDPINHTASSPAKAKMLEHTFHLRPDLQVTISLPADLTEKEADRLGLFIRSIAQ